MLKYIILILFFNLTFSQKTVEDMKNLDTIYVLFQKNDKNQYIPMEKNYDLYGYGFFKNVHFKLNKLDTVAKIYNKRKFFKKNKKAIITIEFFNNNARDKVRFFDKNSKIFFVIEDLENKKNKVKRTRVNSPSFVYY